MKEPETAESNSRSLGAPVFSLSLASFVIAVAFMVCQAGWLLFTKNPYPHSAMASGIMVLYATAIHSVIAALLALVLLGLRAWKRFAIAVVLFGLGLIPAGLLLLLE